MQEEEEARLRDALLVVEGLRLTLLSVGCGLCGSATKEELVQDIREILAASSAWTDRMSKLLQARAEGVGG